METRKVLLTVRSTQQFQNEAPEVTKLVTEGELTRHGNSLCLSYDETELTGLQGTKTSFILEQGKIVLLRTGAVESKMTFVVGQEDCSLYDMGYGALMITVRTEAIYSDLSINGGTLSVFYGIVIEEEAAGTIHYEIQAKPIT